MRDKLRGVKIHDFDLATSALPSQTIEVMNNAGFKTIIDSSKYGTVVFKRRDDEAPIEITTFRGEDNYDDNRHPYNVDFGVDIKQDALRRDFTINSLYMDKDGNIADPNNGIEDINEGLIRAVGNPIRRFNEDALRILRAVRFQAKTGFTIEEETYNAMVLCKSLLGNISKERIFTELTGILTAPGGSSAIRDNLEIIGEIIPELLLQKDFDQKSKYHDKTLLEHTLSVLDGIPVEDSGVKKVEYAYAALLHDIGKPQTFVIDEDGVGHMKKHALSGVIITERIAEELRFSNELKSSVEKLVLYHDSFPAPERKSVMRFISKLSPEFCEKLFVLQRADIMAHSEIGQKRLELLDSIINVFAGIMNEPHCFSVKDLNISGDDLLEIGIPRSPLMGKILNDLLVQVIEERLSNNKEELKNYVQQKYSNC
ncbi:MAG: HD domain-containing protein [Saccharofermentans sp.]|nr:HD domain-containing protein [Saccharofermentans sp.]